MQSQGASVELPLGFLSIVWDISHSLLGRFARFLYRWKAHSEGYDHVLTKLGLPAIFWVKINYSLAAPCDTPRSTGRCVGLISFTIYPIRLILMPLESLLRDLQPRVDAL